MADHNSNLIDRPKAGEEADLLGVNRYIKALSNFLQHASMPTTIAIQGEWGSGKTSVINSLLYDLCDTAKAPDKNKPFHGIFLNMWEYSLLRTPEESIESIIRGLLKQVSLFIELHDHTNPAVDVLKKISKSRLFKAALTSGKVATTLAGATAVNDAIDKIGEMFNGENAEEEFNPAEFREAVANSIDECLRLDREDGDQNKRGFMIFVDDLDRINPESAVQILEMLKNFFEVNCCIFVLAIDYNVVVKGLKAKLGSKDENDERAYRSFFDKIIQMPFTMPTERYKVSDYIGESLKKIGYCTDEDLQVKVIDKEGEENDRTFIQAVAEITANSTGSNPRSIKRLLNTLSLLQYMYEQDSADKEDLATSQKTYVERVINYAFVCIQIAYPEVYRLLAKESVYTRWDRDTADYFKINGFDTFYKSWCKSYDLDEDATNPKLYQAIITAYCKQGSAWLQNRASSIIAILVMIEELCSLNKKDFDLIIPAIIDMSAVTAVTTEEDKKVKVALTKGGQTLLDFWTKFQDIAFESEEFAKLFRRLKPSHNYWMDFSTGNGSCKIGVSNSLSKGELTLYAGISNRELFELTSAHKDEILAAVGEPFEWISFDEVSASGGKGKTAFIRIRLKKDLNDRDAWYEASQWISRTMVALRKALAPYIDKK